jgi:hypothetical protein
VDLDAAFSSTQVRPSLSRYKRILSYIRFSNCSLWHLVLKTSRTCIWHHGLRIEPWWRCATNYGPEPNTQNRLWVDDANRRIHVPRSPYYCQSHRQVSPATGSATLPLHGIGETFHGNAVPATRASSFLHLHWRIPAFQLPYRPRRSIGDVDTFGELLGPDIERGVVSVIQEPKTVLIILTT